MDAYLIADDGELNAVTWIQAVAASLDFWHVEEQLLSFFNLVIKKTELSFDGIYNRTFLLTDSSYLNKVNG